MELSIQKELWPDLPYEKWKDTYATMHMWTQIIGKIRLIQSPWINHSWHVTLYPTSRGLSTLLIPYERRAFQIDFDFISHQLVIQSIDGNQSVIPLQSEPVSEFYRKVFSELDKLGYQIKIVKKPNEVENPIPFDKDEEHRTYDGEYAQIFWQALVQISRVFNEFRTKFIGKCSPVHFFWGAFDLAVTRFSGRRAPQHPGGIPNLPDWVTREAYSHEVSSCGFWPGGGPIPYPAFYSYAYPEPNGFSTYQIRPSEAFYSPDLHEFLLPYDVVKKSDSPDNSLLDFLESTYNSAAELGKWDRSELEREVLNRPSV